MDVFCIPFIGLNRVVDIWGMRMIIPLFCVLLIACSENPPADEGERGMIIVNGVERSELARLMRQMYDEMKLVSDSLESGSSVSPKFYTNYERITSAHATEPEKIDELYQSMADAFLDNYESFEGDEDGQIPAFNIMVDNCLVCHQNKCPGPVKAIKKLKIKPQ